MADEVIFNITGDAAGATTALDDLLASIDIIDLALQGLIDKFAQLDGVNLDTVSTAFDGLATSGDMADKALQSLASSADTAATSLDALTQSVDAASKSLLDLSVNADDAQKALVDTGAGADDAAPALDDVVAASQAAVTSLSDMVPALLDTIAGLTDAATAATDAADAFDRANAAMASSASATSAAASAAAPLASSTQSAATEAENLAASEERAAASSHGFSGGMNESAFALMMLIPMVIQAASSFLSMGTAAEDSIAHISGLADQSLAGAAGMQKLQGVIQALEQDSMKWGVSMKDASDGLYYIISAGFSTNDALKILNVTMEASAATGAKMTDISNALTSVLHAYNLNADQATKITNQMITAVVDGKQNFDEFAKTIGRTAAAGAQAGISFDQVAAAEATMTQINPSVQRDTMNLTHLFITLADKTDKIAAAAKALGLHFDLVKFKSLDLIGKLQYLAQIAGGDNTAAFQKLMTDATSATVAFDLLSNKGQNYTKILQDIREKQQSLAIAFDESSKTITFAWNRIHAALSVISYELVAMSGSTVGNILNKIADALDNIAAHADALRPILVILATTFGGLLLGAIVALAGWFISMMGPLVLISGALGALGGVIALLVPKIEEFLKSSNPLAVFFREVITSVKAAAENLEGAFLGALKALQPMLGDLGKIFRDVIVPALAEFGIGLLQAAASIMNGLAAGLRAVTPLLKEFAAWFHNDVVPAIERAGPTIEKFANILGRLAPLLLGVGGAFMILRPAIGIVGAILPVVGAGFEYIYEGWLILQEGAAGIISFFRGLPALIRAIPGAFSALIDGLKAFGSLIMGPIKTAITAAMNAFDGLAALWSVAANPLDFFLTLLRMAGVALAEVAGDVLALISPIAIVAAAIAVLVAGMIRWFTVTKEGHGAIAVVIKAVQDLWGVLVKSLQPVIKSVQDAIKQLQPVFIQLWQSIQPLIPYITYLGGLLGVTLVASIGIVISVLAGLISGIAQFVAGLIKAIAGVIQFAAGIIQTIVGAITFIVGFLSGNEQTMQQGWHSMGQGLQNIWQGLWNAIVGTAQAVWGLLSGFFSTFVTTIINFFKNLSNVLVGHSIWPDMWNAILNVAKGVATQIIQNILSFFTTIRSYFIVYSNAISTIASQAWTIIQNTIKLALMYIVNFVSVYLNLAYQTLALAFARCYASTIIAWSMIHAWITLALAAIQMIISNALNYIAQLFQQAGAKWQQAMTDAWNKIKTAVSNALNNIASLITSKFNEYVNDIKQAGSKMWQAIVDLWNNIKQKFTDGINNAESALKSGFDKVVQDVKGAGQDMLTAIKNAWQGITQAFSDGVQAISTAGERIRTAAEAPFKDLIDKAPKWGRDFINGFTDGITAGLGPLGGVINGISSMIAGALHFSHPDTGPLADYETWMPDFMQGLAQGINNNLPLLQSAVNNAATVLTGAIPTKADFSFAGAQGNTSAEHLAVLKQILAVLQQQQQSGISGTQIGYSIPSTVLGSIQQQFNLQSSRFSSNDIANIYNQINTLAGLSQEYAGRGATTGVGF